MIVCLIEWLFGVVLVLLVYIARRVSLLVFGVSRFVGARFVVY